VGNNWYVEVEAMSSLHHMDNVEALVNAKQGLDNTIRELWHILGNLHLIFIIGQVHKKKLKLRGGGWLGI
jgi:hypothetical protein